MSVDKPDVIPSPVDPDYDCVRVGSGTARPPGPTNDAAPDPDPATTPLCPDGYVPRRRRPTYRLEGKQIRTGEPPTRNPNPKPPG
jgi:hypothetical protein